MLNWLNFVLNITENLKIFNSLYDDYQHTWNVHPLRAIILILFVYFFNPDVPVKVNPHAINSFLQKTT